MTNSLFDEQSLSIPCPQCGHETAQTIGWIKANGDFNCAGCGQAITLDSEELLGALNEIDEIAAQIPRDIKITL